MSRPPRVLYICGSLNQTTQLYAVSRAMGEHEAWFSPFFTNLDGVMMRKLGLIEFSIGGNKRRAWCVDWLESRGLSVDVDGARGGYDLVVTCTDVIVPKTIRKYPIVGVQEGILDPERTLAWLCRHARFPRWMAGTSLTGESGMYDRYCVASDGYRDDFIARGARADRVVVTGIPNFDDCESFRTNRFPHSGYVLAVTSDTRETMKLTDSRKAFIRKVLDIAAGRPIIFKLHPNEDEARERRLIGAMAPAALVFHSGSAEEMVANASVVVTQWSSVSFVGVALGKEVHSSYPIETLRRLCPQQNGRRSAANIAGVCRELLGLPWAPPRPPYVNGAPPAAGASHDGAA